jgi:hypothetical protein
MSTVSAAFLAVPQGLKPGGDFWTCPPRVCNGGLPPQLRRIHDGFKGRCREIEPMRPITQLSCGLQCAAEALKRRLLR